MKKGMKIGIILSILILLAGIGLGVYGLYLNGWKFDGLMPEYENKTYTSTEIFSKVKVEMQSLQIKIMRSDKFFISYSEIEGEPIEIAVEQDTLNIKSTATQKHLWFKFRPMSITIEIPYAIDNFDVTAKSGSITMSDFENNASAAVNLRSDNGKIEVYKVAAKTMKLYNGNGGISVSHVAINGVDSALTAETNNGKVILGDSKIGNTADLHTDNGAVTVSDSVINKLTAVTSNGRMGILSCNINTADIRTNNGSISVERLTTCKIKAHTDSGSVSVCLNYPAGPESGKWYDIYMRNYLTETGTKSGEYSIELNASGNIEMTFIGEEDSHCGMKY